MSSILELDVESIMQTPKSNGIIIESRSKLWDQDLYQTPDTSGSQKRMRTKSSSSEEDDVSRLMKEMGLPTCFKSTKKPRQRQKVLSEVVDLVDEIDEDLLDDERYQIALESWCRRPEPMKNFDNVNTDKNDLVAAPYIINPSIVDPIENGSGETLLNSDDKCDDWKVVKKKKGKKKKKMKIKKIKVNSKSDRDDKYWHQRYRLFSRFDEGIILDEESWYSVTPERIACHIAERISRYNDADWAPSIIIDGFCGSGGNTIQFANFCDHVIAVDIDPVKIDMAKHNAAVYGVETRIDFIVGDYLQVIKSLKRVIDMSSSSEKDGEVRVAVFMSPPWGGPDYLKKEKYDLHDMTPDGMRIIEATREYLTPNIAILLPRNVDEEQMIASAGPGNQIEMEKNVLNGKVKTITAYYGELIWSSEN